MFTMAHDPVASYFTSDRIAELHDLQAGFPLWCGLWPSPHDSSIERTQWSARSLVQAEAKDITEQVRSQLPSVWRNSERLVPVVTSVPEPDSVPVIRLGVGKIPPPPAPKNFSPLIHWVQNSPPILTALLQARWLITWSEAIRDVWIPRLTERLEADVAYLGDLPSETSTARPLPFGFYAELAWGGPLKDQLRKKLLRSIKDEWLELGREVGVVPSLEGGKRITLQNKFLRQLQREAKRLVFRILRDKTSVEDLEAGLALLGESASANLDHLVKAYADRAARDDLPAVERGKYQQRRERRHAELVRRPEVEEWLSRLRFPMLSGVEIQRIKSRPSARSNSRIRTSIATRVLADRLKVAPGTLRNRLTA